MPKTIVWIEDDTAIIDPVVRPLERAGYEIIRLESAQEALNNISQIQNADLLLLDMILPQGDVEIELSRYPGLDILRELRQTYHISIPVVALTVVTRDEVRQRLHELDVADIIRKPVKPSELKERVEQVLNSN